MFVNLRVVDGSFLSTLSLRRATLYRFSLIFSGGISIHALLAESDLYQSQHYYSPSPFLSTLSLRRATSGKSDFDKNLRFLSTLSLRRATGLTAPATWQHQKFLSTLSLRRATKHYDNYNLHCVISIHALLAESDSKPRRLKSRRMVFLSTLSLRRATNTPIKAYNIIKDFYPRSPCGERQHKRQNNRLSRHFYPRSPCGERLYTD